MNMVRTALFLLTTFTSYSSYALTSTPKFSDKDFIGKYDAASGCIKKVRSNGKETVVTLWMTTFGLSKSECDSVGKTKSVNMATAGWYCSDSDTKPTTVTHGCTLHPDEDLFLKQMKKIVDGEAMEVPYVTFVDDTGHFSKVSFRQKPIIQTNLLCRKFAEELSKNSAFKGARCIEAK